MIRDQGRGSRLHLSCLPVGQVVDRRGMGAKEVLDWDGTEVLGERGWVRKRPGFEWAGMLARDGRVCVCGKWWCGSGRETV